MVSDKQRYLVVNADDFGMSPGVNRGIVEAHEHGILTSTSLMVRGRAAEAAASLTQAHPELSVGLHVDVAEWIYDGRVWTVGYRRVDHEDADAVKREAHEQLERFRSLTGREPTHLDAHQHLHRYEPLASILTHMAAELELPLRWYTRGVRVCGAFYGQSRHGEPDHAAITVEALESVLRAMPAGIGELVCHPGYGEDTRSSYAAEREIELRVLCDPHVREVLAQEGIVLLGFAAVRDLLADAGQGTADQEDADDALWVAASVPSAAPAPPAAPTSVQPGEATASGLPLEVVDFSFGILAPGAAEVCLAARWLEPRRPPLILSQSGAAPQALTPMPAWGETTPDSAAPGDVWTLRARLSESALADGSFELHVGGKLVLLLEVPRAAEAPASGGGGPVRGVRPANDDDPVLANPVSPAFGGSDELDQRRRMVEALAAQNRVLRSRIAELEDALGRAQQAAMVAGQLKELIEAEAGTARARTELTGAQEALRAGIFDVDPDQAIEDLWKIGEEERAAREALEASVQELERARGDVVRALPEST